MDFFDYLTGHEISAWDLGVAGAPMPRWAKEQCLLEIDMVLVELLPGPSSRRPPPWPPSRFVQPGSGAVVGWSPPPRPIDVIASFDPNASKKDQVRAVLYDYYHDDALRAWAARSDALACFVGGTSAKKEDYDPAILITAYENPEDPIWKCGPNLHWKDLDDAVQAAITRRKKLGPLPASCYGCDPVVVYYYDNDYIKRISYPRICIPGALNPQQTSWWKDSATGCAGDTSSQGQKSGRDSIRIVVSNVASQIGKERKQPFAHVDPKTGKTVVPTPYPGAGGWGQEGFDWDKDAPGAIGTIVGVVLAVVSAVLDATGAGAVVGVPLAIATPFIVAAVNALDTGIHTGDWGSALNNLGQGLVSAATQAIASLDKAGIKIPPETLKAMGIAVQAIGAAVAAAQKQTTDYGAIWNEVASKAKSFSHIGDKEAHAIGVFISGKDPKVGKIFAAGYVAGKLTDPVSIAAIAKILQAWAQFSDPRVVNLFLLGAGIGFVSKAQSSGASASTVSGAFATGGSVAACYGPVSYDYPHHGCPVNCWWDALSGVCRPMP